MLVLNHEPIAEFQSTLLMRGATTVVARALAELEFQSTLLMRGATWADIVDRLAALVISIHAPHARSDCVNFRH